MTDTLAPVIFIPHGGGPLPLLGDPAHQPLVDFLRHLAGVLPRPAAVVLISAHWEAAGATVTSGAAPALIYDYGGFPEESYEISYPAPGHPQLAETMAQALRAQGVECRLDPKRGFDHGMFVPMKIMYPDASIPCVQLSLLHSLNAAAHIRLGKALANLRRQDLLVIGSGFSFHNLRAMLAPAQNTIDERNQAFERWLADTCTNPGISEGEREQRLSDWAQAPHARYCHPREEHLLPLHVCYGLGQKPAQQVYDGMLLGKRVSAYLWS